MRALTSPELDEVAGGDYRIEFEMPPVSVVLVGGNNWGSFCVRVGDMFGCLTNHGGQLYWSVDRSVGRLPEDRSHRAERWLILRDRMGWSH